MSEEMCVTHTDGRVAYAGSSAVTSLSARYAFGILRNRLGIRPAQRESVIRWLNNLVDFGYPVADVCDLCAMVTSFGQFYDCATWWLMRVNRNEGRKGKTVLINPHSGLRGKKQGESEGTK